jgi:putative transposase
MVLQEGRPALIAARLPRRSLRHQWRIEYNTERPHSSLGKLTPQEFAKVRLEEQEEGVSLPADFNQGSD